MKTLASIELLLVLPLIAFGQTRQGMHGDCSSPVDLYANQEYIHEESPAGHGDIQEFTAKQGRPYLFPAEINTVWYRFRAPVAGTIVFEVTPFSARDDYDWMLFNGRCDSITGYKRQPLRTNRARNDVDIGGNTGLREGYDNLHAPPGPGKSYSKPLEVQRGETYLLVLDNIYPNGKGHRIVVRYTGKDPYRPLTITGKVIDKATGKPLAAKIYAVEDSTGRPLLTPTASAVTADPWQVDSSQATGFTQASRSGSVNVDSGTINFSFTVAPRTSLHMAALKKGYLLTTLNFQVTDADTSLVVAMEPAAKGGKMILFNIRFMPNKADFQPDAHPELQRLLEFMQQSPEKYIRITGHTNSNVFTRKSWLLDLSVYRAAAVRDFLTGNGIDPNRIRIAGAGGSRPLTHSNDMKEAMKNLRVEIELLN